MEILIGIVIVSIQDWITDMRFYSKRHLKELKNPEFFSRTYDMNAEEIKRAMHAYKVTCAEHTLSTGEDKIIFKKELNEAERLIEEAKEKQV